MKIKFIIFMFLLVFVNNLFAQGRVYEGPDDPAGDIAAERTGFMNGNRVLLYYSNTTEQGAHVNWFSSKWPNTLDGTKMHDGICLLIGARVYVENDSVPVTDPDIISSHGNLDTLYYCQSSYREYLDKNPTETVEWGFYPVFGYFNEFSETPAMSNREDSWPEEGWPSADDEFIWPGKWNGRFGMGVVKADLESYFVVNDAHDQEYLGEEDQIKYYPRPGIFIGDKKPDVSIQKGLPWGGIGIRVQGRGFQWSNPSAHDAIFWEYGVANISEYDLPEMYFGIYTDNAVGGESAGGGDDIAFYNDEPGVNMCYSWDKDGIPYGGGSKAPGVYGLAYLESPGIPENGIDDDTDGLIDEKRDNNALVKIGPFDGISNLDDFKAFYNKNDESEFKEHWDADEDQDWDDWDDANGNGKYDVGENAGDDVGLDGVGPMDLHYTGPDADSTECNHRPDRTEGYAEPDFAETDVSESDMLGLTSFRYCFQWGATGQSVMNDHVIFEFHNEKIFDEAQMSPTNFVEQFASGLFPLKQGLTERISMSELHAYEVLAGLNSDTHDAPALFRLKEIVQLIYERDYRFAQPPTMPTLTAKPADGKVFLSWDTESDQNTKDDFAFGINDFEGYKLYRSSDPYMADPMIITDGYGSPTLRKAIFQCDLIDGKKGFADYGEINGIEYYLGTDNGITHSFIDNTVQNGQTYYYVLVAYDYGLKDVGGGISPSENTFVLEIDESENIRRISRNVAVVKPHQFAAGYPDQGVNINDDLNSVVAKKLPFTVDIFDIDKVKKGHTYKLKMNVNEDLGYYKTNTGRRSPYDLFYYNDEFMIYDVTLGDSLIYHETKDDLSGSNFDSLETHGFHVVTDQREIVTELFDGLRLRFRMPTVFPKPDLENTGWVVGNSPVNFFVAADNYKFFPWHYEVIWTDDPEAYTTRVNILFKNVRDRFGQYLDRKKFLFDTSFNFYVVNKSFVDSTGNYPVMDMIVYDDNDNQQFDPEYDTIFIGDVVKDSRGRDYNFYCGSIFTIDFQNVTDQSEMPKPNDVYRFMFKRSFHHSDSLMFTITGLDDEIDLVKLKQDMENIRVVPNPYVVTNSMESAVANWERNQRRQIMFTHIPAKCTITIFTISGMFVDEIKVDNSIDNRSSIWDINSSANGTVHWDLRSKEGLEIAAGYYVYHVKSELTGDVKIGKFAVIK